MLRGECDGRKGGGRWRFLRLPPYRHEQEAPLKRHTYGVGGDMASCTLFFSGGAVGDINVVHGRRIMTIDPRR